MFETRPPLKPLIWAGRICMWMSILMALVGLGLWTGVGGQIIDPASGQDRSSMVAQLCVFGGLWGLVVGYFAIRAGTKRDII